MACVTVSLDIKTRLHAQAESVLYLLITVSSWNVKGSSSDSSSSGSSSKEVSTLATLPTLSAVITDTCTSSTLMKTVFALTVLRSSGHN